MFGLKRAELTLSVDRFSEFAVSKLLHDNLVETSSRSSQALESRRDTAGAVVGFFRRSPPAEHMGYEATHGGVSNDRCLDAVYSGMTGINHHRLTVNLIQRR